LNAEQNQTYPMQRNTRQNLSGLFWTIAGLDILAILINSKALNHLAKPLLLPVLIISLLHTRPKTPGKKLLLSGLIFSWAGDIALMFDDRFPVLFIYGLVCFLTTHVFYIIYFLSLHSPKTSLLKKNPLLLILVIGYGISLVGLLFPRLGSLEIPVTVYATVICIMLLSCLHAYSKISHRAANAYLLGASMFVLSDSLLAFNKFYHNFPFASALIILTYCMAQYFIVLGFWQENR
jgi:uncharacterized membrane protein YhhN